MAEVGQVEGEASVSSLFDSTKDRVFNFGRGKSPADIITIVNRRLAQVGPGDASREQVKAVLESVPEILPEDWKAPIGQSNIVVRSLTEAQREDFARLQTLGPKRISAPKIQAVIESGMHFRDNFSD